jgi:hypothetical protein
MPGKMPPSDSKADGLKNPKPFYGKSQPGHAGKGDKGSQRIQLFKPRGPKGFSKVVMPRSGRRSTGPKSPK